MEAPRPASPDPWPAEAAWNRPGAVPSLLIPGRWTKLAGPPSPSFLPTHPTQGGSLRSQVLALYCGQADKSQLWANRLFAYVPRPKSSGPEADLDSVRSRWGRRSIACSCSKKATTDWNHVVGIKSRSPSFLS